MLIVLSLTSCIYIIYCTPDFVHSSPKPKKNTFPQLGVDAFTVFCFFYKNKLCTWRKLDLGIWSYFQSMNKISESISVLLLVEWKLTVLKSTSMRNSQK